MLEAPIPSNEKERLESVNRLAILDTKPEDRFDKLTLAATKLLNVPISTFTVIDEKREWYKSCVGLDQKEGERAISFCGHALLAKDIFIVEDTLKDPRFADNPMVVGPPYIRFYAGVAVRDHKTNNFIGVFCVKDTKPRVFSVEETAILIKLAGKVEEELNKSN